MSDSTPTTPTADHTGGDAARLALRAADAAALLGISRAQFFKLHSEGRMPLPVRLGPRAPRWLVSDLKEWLAAGAPSRDAWERMKSAKR
jgi:predicted DNA-binding transcriptional regulator AlpA